MLPEGPLTSLPRYSLSWNTITIPTSIMIVCSCLLFSLYVNGDIRNLFFAVGQLLFSHHYVWEGQAIVPVTMGHSSPWLQLSHCTSFSTVFFIVYFFFYQLFFNHTSILECLIFTFTQWTGIILKMIPLRRWHVWETFWVLAWQKISFQCPTRDRY